MPEYCGRLTSFAQAQLIVSPAAASPIATQSR